MRRMRVAVLALAAAGIGAGLAYGAGTLASDTIHACVLPSGLVKIASTCGRSETELTWSQTGPTGAQGPAGEQGPAGQQGPTGPQGPVGPTVA